MEEEEKLRKQLLNTSWKVFFNDHYLHKTYNFSNKLLNEYSFYFWYIYINIENNSNSSINTNKFTNNTNILQHKQSDPITTTDRG